MEVTKEKKGKGQEKRGGKGRERTEKGWEWEGNEEKKGGWESQARDGAASLSNILAVNVSVPVWS